MNPAALALAALGIYLISCSLVGRDWLRNLDGLGRGDFGPDRELKGFTYFVMGASVSGIGLLMYFGFLLPN